MSRTILMGWSGGAKVSCILCHRGVQLILAYSWARSAILVAGKGREVMFLFLLFLHFHSCSSFFPVPLFHLFCFLICRFFSLSLGDDTKWPTRVDVSLTPTQSIWSQRCSSHQSLTVFLGWKNILLEAVLIFRLPDSQTPKSNSRTPAKSRRIMNSEDNQEPSSSKAHHSPRYRKNIDRENRHEPVKTSSSSEISDVEDDDNGDNGYTSICKTMIISLYFYFIRSYKIVHSFFLSELVLVISQNLIINHQFVKWTDHRLIIDL